MAKYDASFWRRVLGRTRATAVFGTLKRIVENQEQKVTVPLVDTLEEHDVLEDLLEESKPDYLERVDIERFDYLLRTPWRYPPLPWGSRFGRHFEPSLFYGAQTDNGLLAEAAYYRLVFLEGMREPFRDRVISQHTVFEARYQSDNAYDLCKPPFAKHAAALRHASDYRPCQELGSVLRARGARAIKYFSARAREQEVCVALFSPAALRSRKHMKPRHSLCQTQHDGVTFSIDNVLHRFERDDFSVDGVLPMPAA